MVLHLPHETPTTGEYTSPCITATTSKLMESPTSVTSRPSKSTESPPRTFEEIKTAVWEHWDYDDEGIVHIKKEGGLTPGIHEIEFQQSVLAAYGYLPTDEEWVKCPPEPGTGAGSDKTKNIVTYRLKLQEQEEEAHGKN